MEKPKGVFDLSSSFSEVYFLKESRNIANEADDDLPKIFARFEEAYSKVEGAG